MELGLGSRVAEREGLSFGRTLRVFVRSDFHSRTRSRGSENEGLIVE